MLSLFRKNPLFSIISVIFILLLSAILSLYSKPPHYTFACDLIPMPLFRLITLIMNPFSITGMVIATLLVLFNGYYLSRLFNLSNSPEDKSYIPVFLYLITIFSFLPPIYLNATIPASTFFLLGLKELLNTYRKEVLAYNLISGGLFFSVSGLFYFPSFLFLPLAWIVPALFGRSSWREYLFPVIGFFIPVFIVLSIYYITDTPIIKAEAFFSIESVKTHEIFQNLRIIIFAVFILFLTIVSSLKQMQSINKYHIRTQVFNICMFFIVTISLIAYYLIPSCSIEIAHIVFMPVVIIFSDYLIKGRKTNFMEITFAVYVLLALLNIFFR